MNATRSGSDSSEELQTLFSLQGRAPIMVDLEIEGKEMKMELDTGAAVSVISQKEFDKRFRMHVPLERTTLELHTYTKETVKPVGKCTVNVQYDGACKRLTLYVLKNQGPALLGREWLAHIRLKWPLLVTESRRTLESILERHATVFSEGLGRLRHLKARIPLKENARPRFWSHAR